MGILFSWQSAERASCVSIEAVVVNCFHSIKFPLLGFIGSRFGALIIGLVRCFDGGLDGVGCVSKRGCVHTRMCIVYASRDDDV